VVLRLPIAAACALLASSAFAAPLPTSDQNPFLAGFSLPQPPPARLREQGSIDTSFAFNWSNTAAYQQTPTEELTVDLESRESLLTVAYALTDSVTARVHVPYREYSGGHLDSAVEAWHTAFGFPEGDRAGQPRNRFLIEYERSGTDLQMIEAGSGLGDIAIDLGLRVFAGESANTAVWWRLKLPTGDSYELLGSGSLGASVDFVHEHRLSSRWELYGGVGATYLSRGDLLPAHQQEWIWRGTLALTYRYSQGLSFTLQTDGRTSAFDDTTVAMLGNAWLIGLGAEYRWPSRWRVQLGLTEDAAVEASPDVTFVIGLGKEW